MGKMGLMKGQKQNAVKGRPRSFDLNKALDNALRVFWEKGYEGASLTDLTNAMGINRPSMYAAFGDKEELFRKALDRYAKGPAAYAYEALSEATARKAIEKLLLGAVEALSNPKNPKGCLLVQGALACGDESTSIREELIQRRIAAEAEIAKRLKRARAEGELPEEVNPSDLARFYVTVMRGLGVEAATGATRSQLLRVVETAMKAWPAEV